MRVQVEKVWGYDEDQVSLVVPDSTDLGSWVLFTLGRPTINQIINMIKESKINELLVSLNGSRIAQLLACQWAGLLIQRGTVTNQTVDLTGLNKAVKMTKKEEVNASSSKIIHSRAKTLLLGNNMHVMTQSPKGGDGPHLPLEWVWWTHTPKRFLGASELQWWWITWWPFWSLLPRVPVVPVNMLPPVEVTLRTLQKLGEIQGIK